MAECLRGIPSASSSQHPDPTYAVSDNFASLSLAISPVRIRPSQFPAPNGQAGTRKHALVDRALPTLSRRRSTSAMVFHFSLHPLLTFPSYTGQFAFYDPCCISSSREQPRHGASTTSGKSAPVSFLSITSLTPRHSKPHC